jgi:predicted membrane-bound mannosyltransferase
MVSDGVSGAHGLSQTPRRWRPTPNAYAVSVAVLEAQRAIARPAWRVSSVAVEIAAVAAIVVAAALVRWPELIVVPRFTDESSEILLGVSIARGEALPLANWHPHIGAAFNYLVAAVLLVAGPTMAAGRLVVWLLGALAVVPAYLLDRSIGGAAVGGLAALFLATSGTHIVVNSHIAYSHSVMPLFATLSL